MQFTDGELFDGLQAIEDEAELMVVMIAIALGALPPCTGDSGASCFIGQVQPDLLDTFFHGREEDCLFVLGESAEMAGRALDQQESRAGRDLKTLVGELILIGFGKEAEIDLRSPNALAIGIGLKFAFAIDLIELRWSEGTLPCPLGTGDYDRQAGLGKLCKKLGAVVVGRANERHASVAIGVRPALRGRIMSEAIVGSLDFDDVTRTATFEVGDADIALGAVKIKAGDGLLVQTHACVAARPEGVIDHVTDGLDTQTATLKDGRGMELQHLVRPKDIRLVMTNQMYHLSIQTDNIGTGGEMEADFAEQSNAGCEGVGIQRDNFMPHSL